MTEPTRLIDEDATDFERLLLDSGAGEKPAGHLEANMLAPVGGATATAAAVPALVKWLLGGAGLLGGALLALEMNSADPAPAPTDGMTSAPGAMAGVDEAPRTESVQSDEDSEQSPPKQRESLPVKDEQAPPKRIVTPAGGHPQPTSGGTADASTEKGSSLAQELKILEGARRAVESGDAPSALAAVAQYRSRFPRGKLTQEATVIEVKALALKGKKDEARRLTDEFIDSHPDSAHRKALEGGPAK